MKQERMQHCGVDVVYHWTHLQWALRCYSMQQTSPFVATRGDNVDWPVPIYLGQSCYY